MSLEPSLAEPTEASRVSPRGGTRCPLCHTPLPDGARECTHCDWVSATPTPQPGPDWKAALLSAVPGFGHAYKGHFLLAVIIFIVGNLVVLPLAVVTAPGTLGLSLALVPAYVLGLGVHAFHAPDLRAEAREGKAVRRLDPLL